MIISIYVDYISGTLVHSKSQEIILWTNMKPIFPANHHRKWLPDSAALTVLHVTKYNHFLPYNKLVYCNWHLKNILCSWTFSSLTVFIGRHLFGDMLHKARTFDCRIKLKVGDDPNVSLSFVVAMVSTVLHRASKLSTRSIQSHIRL